MSDFRDLSYAPHTGFGDNYDTSLKFSIEHPKSMGFPSWSGGPKVSEHDRLNGDNLSIQYHGQNPWGIELVVWLANEYDLERLEALAGRTWGTLRYRQGLTRRVGGTEEEISGITYLTLSNTFLRAVSNQVMFEDGTCQATLTLLREYVASTLPGFAPYPLFAPSPSGISQPTLLLPLNGSLSGTNQLGLVSATGLAPIRYRDGFVTGSSPVLKNLIKNPSAEVDIFDWETYHNTPGGVTLTSSTSWAHSGTSSFRLEAVVPAYMYAYIKEFITEVVPGEHFSVGAWCYTTSPGVQAAIYPYFYADPNGYTGGGGVYSENIPLVPGVPKFISAEGLFVPPNSVRGGIELDFYAEGYVELPIGTVVHFDSVMWTRTATVPDYFDGSVPGPHSWTGTAHASTSAREAKPGPALAPPNINYAKNPRAISTADNWYMAGEQTGTWITDSRAIGGTARKATSNVADTAARLIIGAAHSAGLWGQMVSVAMSVAAWSDDPGITLALSVGIRYTDGTETYSDSTYLPVTAEPTRFSHSINPNFNKSVSYGFFYIYAQGLSSGKSIIASNSQYEKGVTIASPYFDGAMGGVHSWLRAPNSSPSIRRGTADQSAFIEEGTTNYVPNPWLRDGITGWSVLGGTLAHEVDEQDTPFPESVSRLRHTRDIAGVANQGIYPTADGGVTESTVYTFSGFVVCPDPKVTLLRIDWMNNVGSFISSEPTVTLASLGFMRRRAQRFIHTPPASPLGATRARIRIYTTTGALNEVMFFTGFQCERKNYATTPCPQLDPAGTILPGHTWAGTAHNSASTRAGSGVNTPVTFSNSQQGAVLFRVTREYDTNGYQFLAWLGTLTNGTNTILFEVPNFNDVFRLRMASGGTAGVALASTVTLRPGEDHLIYCEWDAGVVSLFVDNVFMGTASFATWYGIASTTLYLGGSIDTYEQINGRVAMAIALNAPLTTDERMRITALMESGNLDWSDFIS